MTSDLTTPSGRERAILKIVVDDFVRTAHPVASKRLKEKYGVELSPASIRNTLHSLEEVGLLSHLHTSSGRVPTDFGYRYYVDELLESKVASESLRRRAMEELTTASTSVERLLQITANSLAQLNKLFGFTILSADDKSELTDLDLVQLSSGQVLLVVGFKSEQVKTVVLNLSMEMRGSAVEMVASMLRERLVGLTVSEIRDTIGDRLRDRHLFDSEIVQVIIANAEEYFAVSLDDEIYASSKDQLWQHPEFGELADMQSMISTLDDTETIRSSAGLSVVEGGVGITIGSENADHTMQSCSVVTKTINVGGASACLGVIGPTRMDYSEVVTVVNLFASAIDEMIHA